MSSPTKRPSGALRRKAPAEAQDRTDRMLARFETVDRLVEGDAREDIMESKSVSEFFRRGSAAAGVGSFWARAAGQSAARARRANVPAVSVEGHLENLQEDGNCSPDADELMAEIDEALSGPGLRDSVADDPLLAPDVGFVQRKSPLSRRLNTLATALPSAGRAKKKSPGPLQRAGGLARATVSIAKSQVTGSRKSPRLAGIVVPSPAEKGAAGTRVTPGLSAKTPKSSRRASKTKRWMSALETLSSTLRTSNGGGNGAAASSSSSSATAAATSATSATSQQDDALDEFVVAAFAPATSRPTRAAAASAARHETAVAAGPSSLPSHSSQHLGVPLDSFTNRFAKPSGAGVRSSPRKRGGAQSTRGHGYLTGLSSSL